LSSYLNFTRLTHFAIFCIKLHEFTQKYSDNSCNSMPVFPNYVSPVLANSGFCMTNRPATKLYEAQAELYYLLAEALVEPPPWLAEAGTEWPLFAVVSQLAQLTGSRAARRAVKALRAIPAEDMSVRRRRYRLITTGAGGAPLSLYESIHREGKLYGPSTLAVAQVYHIAGLEPDGAELPDHASVELSFLGWLAEKAAASPEDAADWQDLARKFIAVHTGQWLPEVGQTLAFSSDAVYAPLGYLLMDWLKEATHPPRPKRAGEEGCDLRLPVIPDAETCTLCGFCVQICPTQALLIKETGTETGLILKPLACISCGKCERVCEYDALIMQQTGDTVRATPHALRISRRVACAHCGAPMVSAAELDAIAVMLGERPQWLNYCMDCRPLFI